ncbi:recombinase family protein [Photobacterium piscicola]|uniref:Recombinase family protein n=1 Tax=Photobacterium piscicola TaxID=1378299 RepID=A0ABU6LD10_9GAMM|nr:recombinase family protein [Photobacterium piscicola]
MRQAVLYQRFSSTKQINNSSLFRQTEAQENWLKSNDDVVVIDCYVDEAMSGWTGKHLKKGSLGVLLQACKDKKIPTNTLILVEHFSRLSRMSISDTESLLREIWNYGITLITVRDNQEYPPSTIDNLEKRISLLLQIDSAYKESKWRSEKVKGSYEKRLNDAKNGIVPRIRKPFWLDQNGKLNEHSVIFKDIFDLYLKGYGQNYIIKHLRKTYPNSLPAQRINPSTMMQYMKKEIIIGRWKGVKIYDSVVDEKDFYEALNIRETKKFNNVSPNRTYPLSGLFRCACCDAGMSIQKSNHAKPVIRCANQLRMKECNRKKTFPYSVAHFYLIKFAVKKILINISNKENCNSSSKELIEFNSELNSLKNERKELNEIYCERKKEGQSLKSILNMIIDNDDLIDNLEYKIKTKENELKHSTNNINDNVLKMFWDKETFNIAMHKLNIVFFVGDNYIQGFIGNNPLSEKLYYRGYSRKNKIFECELSNEFYEVSSFEEDFLELDLKSFLSKINNTVDLIKDRLKKLKELNITEEEYIKERNSL